MKVLKLLTTVISLVLLTLIPGVIPTTPEELTVQTQALQLISEFADKMCRTIPLEGEGYSAKLSGEGEIELNNLLKQLVKLKIGGAADFDIADYKGLLQRDLPEVLKESTSCKLIIWEGLKHVFFPDTTKRGDIEWEERPNKMALLIESQSAEAARGDKLYNFVTFRITNTSESNVKDVTIEIIPGPWPTYPLPRRDDRTFFFNTSRCKTISTTGEYIWKIYCDYIGVGGVIGFAVNTDHEDGFPSGEVVVSNPEATYRYSF